MYDHFSGQLKKFPPGCRIRRWSSDIEAEASLWLKTKPDLHLNAAITGAGAATWSKPEAICRGR
jgi:hypothetical protein